MNEKDLPDNARALWLKSMHAIEIRNYGYAISLLQAVLKDFPMFLDGRKRLRKVEIIASKGKKSFLSGLSTASLKGSSMIKKDPKAAMELAEKSLENDPFNSQINHLLKEAAKAANYPEIAAFALETIIEGAPTDTKTMHELGLHYLSMGEPQKAVDIYSKIAEINPADLAAVKNSKDAAATASMKSGGWEQATSYRDLIRDKDEAVSLEQKSRVVKSTEMIDQQIGELTPEWEQAQENVDLSRRVARLWEDRFEQEGDEESFNGALYFYQHINGLLSGSDPTIVRKLSELNLKRLDLHMKPLETWLADYGDSDHEDATQARDQFAAMKKEKAELLIDDAKKRVERNPTDLQLRFELGEQLFNAGQYRAAVQELQKARQNPNARLRAMNLLGQCYTEMNMLDLAIKQFQDSASEIAAMDSTKKEILYKLGLIYERLGKKEEYLKCMKDIYEVDYGYRDVAQRVEQSYAA
jgi:tetratricopeptide (TPR) repeat protein